MFGVKSDSLGDSVTVYLAPESDSLLGESVRIWACKCLLNHDLSLHDSVPVLVKAQM